MVCITYRRSDEPQIPDELATRWRFGDRMWVRDQPVGGDPASTCTSSLPERRQGGGSPGEISRRKSHRSDRDRHLVRTWSEITAGRPGRLPVRLAGATRPGYDARGTCCATDGLSGRGQRGCDPRHRHGETGGDPQGRSNFRPTAPRAGLELCGGLVDRSAGRGPGSVLSHGPAENGSLPRRVRRSPDAEAGGDTRWRLSVGASSDGPGAGRGSTTWPARSAPSSTYDTGGRVGRDLGVGSRRPGAYRSDRSPTTRRRLWRGVRKWGLARSRRTRAIAGHRPAHGVGPGPGTWPLRCIAEPASGRQGRPCPTSRQCRTADTWRFPLSSSTPTQLSTCSPLRHPRSARTGRRGRHGPM